VHEIHPKVLLSSKCTVKLVLHQFNSLIVIYSLLYCEQLCIPGQLMEQYCSLIA